MKVLYIFSDFKNMPEIRDVNAEVIKSAPKLLISERTTFKGTTEEFKSCKHH
jgi:hypothetical protein